MGMKLYLTKQLFGQRQNFILCAEDMLNCDATCNLLKVLKLDFQCQGSAFKLILCNTTLQFEDSVLKFNDGSRLVTDLLSGLSAMEEETVAIPAGSLTGLTLLSGHGFSIPVKLLGVTNIRSRLDSTLTAAGINQTLHRIDLVVEADLVLLLPGGPCAHSISTRLPLTETVLLGQVPDNYTYFSQFDSAREAADAYFDYGAGQH